MILLSPFMLYDQKATRMCFLVLLGGNKDFYWAQWEKLFRIVPSDKADAEEKN